MTDETVALTKCAACRKLRPLTYAIVLLFAVLFAYVRLAPTDPAAWHQPIAQSESVDLAGGAVRVIDGDEETLAQIDAAMRALPRTHVLAGTREEGRLTYVTRSRIWGFPDFTTLEISGDTVKLFARLRFGASDLGVNRQRLEQVLAAIQA